MNQRAGKMHNASLRDGDNIKLGDLVEFCERAQKDLEKLGEEDSALRFELFTEFLRKDFKGGHLRYTSRALGL